MWEIVFLLAGIKRENVWNNELGVHDSAKLVCLVLHIPENEVKPS